MSSRTRYEERSFASDLNNVKGFSLSTSFTHALSPSCHCEEERRSNLVAILIGENARRLPRYARNDIFLILRLT
ncbi:hypothetical protein SAMN05428975_3796 [Mucilaginibacter sp. OK268]|nr:hypothetical protein SAMN05428975_3796 [Mucilaginibacter sp. OK268]